MNAWQFLLFAQHGRLDALSDGFRGHSDTSREDMLIGLLILATVGAGVWAATRLWTSRTNGQPYDHPWQLFRSLCKAHRLTWSERGLLRRLAAQQGLKDPARVFLEADLWEPNRIPASIRHEFNRLNAIRRRLFDVPADASPESRLAAGKQPLFRERRRSPVPSIAAMSPSDSEPMTMPAPSARRSAALETTSRAAPLATPRTASPLLPPLSSPTLDLPPWTAKK